jgi:hypothetical protein
MPVSYCVKCKRKTETTGSKKVKTANNRNAITGHCKVCGTKKYMFVK